MAATAARIAEVLAGLRAASARLCIAAEVRRAHLPLGLAGLDQALGGGLPRGKLTELTGARSSGRMSIALGAIVEAQRAGELTAIVDAADAFDPRSAHAAGVLLPRLLWVRPSGFLGGLQAADRVLDAGGFGLLVVYLSGVPLSERRTQPLQPARPATASPPPPSLTAAQLAARTARDGNDYPQSRLYGHDAGKLANRRAGALARRDAPEPAPAVERSSRPSPTARPRDASIAPSLRELRVEPYLERGVGQRHRKIPPGGVGAPAWARLQQRAEKSGTAVLLVAEHSLAGSFAVATLEARRGRATWTSLLDSIEGTVLIVRSKLGAPGGIVELIRAAG